MTASQTRSQAVRQSLSLNLRIEPSPYNSSSKVVLTAHTPSSAAMAIRAEADAANPSSESSEDNIIEFSVLCHYEYVADESGLMSFKKGEILDIIKRDDTGWWAALRQEGPVVGWIPQAYVTPLSEEMAEKLRSIGEEFRVAEYEAEQLYNTAPVDRGLPVFEPDFDSVLPEPEDDPIPRKVMSSSMPQRCFIQRLPPDLFLQPKRHILPVTSRYVLLEGEKR
ncbi:hypothetical protein NLJ89_g5823 [Agrocybe chaxingu]|uniref:SH3 domain-containing protein n=1 Tax=Agrocybe chaxingu TaxID=84603 RepID=A0A9W8MX02_9AGAR|nr:hypothetical protein NLJ89_g5823 [Agrocybe chaxingu]